jgi:hypothetical protein
VHLRRGDEPRVVAALQGRKGRGRDDEGRAQRRRQGGERLRHDLTAAADDTQTLLDAAEVGERVARADLVAELHEVFARDLEDVHVHHDLGALLVDGAEQLADEADVLGRVADGDGVGRLVGGDDRLAPGLRRDRGRDELLRVVRVYVVEVEGAQHQLLVLRALELVGDDDGARGELLEEEPLREEDVVERLRGRHVDEVNGDFAPGEVAVEDDVDPDLAREVADELFEVAAVLDRLQLLVARGRERVVRAPGRFVGGGLQTRRGLRPRDGRRTFGLLPLALAGLKPERALHHRARELVRRVVAVGAAEGVVGAEVVAALQECRALLRKCLRGVEERAAEVELVLAVRGLGRGRERELLGRLLPLLRRLLPQPLLVVLLPLARPRDGRRREQAEREQA